MQTSNYIISDDPSLLDIDFIVHSLHSTYWAGDRPRDMIIESIRCSLCLGAYCAKQQVGFARVVTDGVTFSWLCDVFTDPLHRSQGLGKRLVAEVIRHPKIGQTRIYLATRDAHGLYEKFGFMPREVMFRNDLPYYE